MFLTRRKGTEAEVAKHPAADGRQQDLFGTDAPPTVQPTERSPGPPKPPRPRRGAPPEPSPSLTALAAEVSRPELDELVATLSDEALAHLALHAVRALRRRAGPPVRGKSAGRSALGRTARLLAEEVSGMLGGGEG